MKHGRLVLNTVEITLPDGKAPQSVKVTVDGQEIPSSFKAGHRVEVSFDEQIVGEGGNLTVTAI